MLVLTRKAKQQIRLGDDIIVTVLQVKGNAIRIGIEAPRETRIVRGELEFFADEPEKIDAPHQSSVASDSTVSVSGPIKLKIQSDTAKQFPRTMARVAAMPVEARPLKSFMPKSMRETVGNVSV